MLRPFFCWTLSLRRAAIDLTIDFQLNGDQLKLESASAALPASYSPHIANASLNARSPGAPFSIAMMARRWLT